MPAKAWRTKIPAFRIHAGLNHRSAVNNAAESEPEEPQRRAKPATKDGAPAESKPASAKGALNDSKPATADEAPNGPTGKDQKP